MEDERKDPVPLTEATDSEEEHFLMSGVRYLEVEEGLAESEHLSKAEYQLRKYCRKEKPTAGEFHTLKTGGSRFVFRITHVTHLEKRPLIYSSIKLTIVSARILACNNCSLSIMLFSDAL